VTAAPTFVAVWCNLITLMNARKPQIIAACVFVSGLMFTYLVLATGLDRDSRYTALADAVAAGDTPTVRAIAQEIPDINVQFYEPSEFILRLKSVFGWHVRTCGNRNYYDGDSLLIIAARWRRADVARTLIRLGCDLDTKNAHGESAADVAKQLQDRDMLLALSVRSPAKRGG
jgi:hypothetical protein